MPAEGPAKDNDVQRSETEAACRRKIQPMPEEGEK